MLILLQFWVCWNCWIFELMNRSILVCWLVLAMLTEELTNIDAEILVCACCIMVPVYCCSDAFVAHIWFCCLQSSHKYMSAILPVSRFLVAPNVFSCRVFLIELWCHNMFCVFVSILVSSMYFTVLILNFLCVFILILLSWSFCLSLF